MPEMQTLTAEYVLSLEAGREMDALVAEHVMGWKKRPLSGLCWWKSVDGEWCPAATWGAWQPSTKAAPALWVVNAMRDRPGQVAARLGFYIDSTAPEGTRGVSVAFGRHVAGAYVPADTRPVDDETERLTSLAICRAALLAVISQREDGGA